jgi:UDP-N-acetylbacillosamine N-acetyltransferase
MAAPPFPKTVSLDPPPPLVIWGASGHALVVADAARVQGKFSIAGFLDDRLERKGSPFAGSEVLGGRDALRELYARGVRHLHVAVGHCATRLKLASFAQSEGFVLATVVHPSAVIAESTPVGDGTFVAAGVVVNVGARVGESVILNTSCSVDHECHVQAGVHLGPGVRLGGGVQVGRAAWVGIGATILDHLSIGEGTIVGGGAVVVRDIPAGVVAYGMPARVVRSVNPED